MYFSDQAPHHHEGNLGGVETEPALIDFSDSLPAMPIPPPPPPRSYQNLAMRPNYSNQSFNQYKLHYPNQPRYKITELYLANKKKDLLSHYPQQQQSSPQPHWQHQRSQQQQQHQQHRQLQQQQQQQQQKTRVLLHQQPLDLLSSIEPLSSLPRPFSKYIQHPINTTMNCSMEKGVVKEEKEGGEDEKKNPWSAVYQDLQAKKRARWFFTCLIIIIAGVVCGGIVGWHFRTSPSTSDANDSTALKGNVSTTAAGVGRNPTNNIDRPQVDTTPKIKGFNANTSIPSIDQMNSTHHQAFYGINYSPFHTQTDSCALNQSMIMEDVQQLAQLTRRLKLDASECDSAGSVLQAIQSTKVDLKVFLNLKIGRDALVNERQKQWAFKTIQNYGNSLLLGVTIGEGYLLAHPDHRVAIPFVLDHIKDFKSRLLNLALNATLPIGTGDVGPSMSSENISQVDFMMIHLNPFTANVPSSQASQWTLNKIHEQNKTILTTSAKQTVLPPISYFTGIGWPTQSMSDSSSGSNRAVKSVSTGVADLQRILDDFVCQANTLGIPYFWASAYDRSVASNTQGDHKQPFYYGLFDADRKLKNITIPSCVNTS